MYINILIDTVRSVSISRQTLLHGHWASLLLDEGPKPGLHKSRARMESDLNIQLMNSSGQIYVSAVCQLPLITGTHWFTIISSINCTSPHRNSINQTKSSTNSQIKFMEIALCVARECLTVTWKSDSPLLVDRWKWTAVFLLKRSHIVLEKDTILFWKFGSPTQSLKAHHWCHHRDLFTSG